MIKLKRIKDGSVIKLDNEKWIEDSVSQFINHYTCPRTITDNYATLVYIESDNELYLVGYKDYHESIKSQLEEMNELFGYEVILESESYSDDLLFTN